MCYSGECGCAPWALGVYLLARRPQNPERAVLQGGLLRSRDPPHQLTQPLETSET